MKDFNSDDDGPSGRRNPKGRRFSGRRTNNRRDPGRSNRRPSNRREFRSRNPEERTMHKVVCDACGETCEVPFKPTEGKPIYCDTCFKKNKPSVQGQTSSFAKELSEINEKLDKILTALEVE